MLGDLAASAHRGIDGMNDFTMKEPVSRSRKREAAAIRQHSEDAYKSWCNRDQHYQQNW